MSETIAIAELSKLPLVFGISEDGYMPTIQDPETSTDYKAEVIKASALIRIANALEAQTEILQATRRASFSDAQRQDGLNHFQGTHVKGTNLVQIDYLASSPAEAEKFILATKEAVEIAIKQGGEHG